MHSPDATPADSTTSGASGLVEPRTNRASRRLGALVPTAAGTSLAVWLVWAAMLGAHFALALTMLNDVPLGDEWFTLGSIAGIEPFDLEFLWRRHNEHRIPITKLVLWVCYHAGNFDFRTAPWVYVSTLGVVTAAAIRVARKLRGRPSLADAALPLLLLNWGHQENTLWGFQAQMIGSASISLALLFWIARRRTPLGIGAAAFASFVVCTIALCGQNGVLLVPALSVWIGWSAFEQWRARGDRAALRSTIVGGFAALPLALVALIMHGLPLPERKTIVPDFRVALEFFMNGLGRATMDHQTSGGVFVLALIVVSIGLVVVRWRRAPEERFRLVGLVCFCGSVATLGLAMGFGRTSAYQLRYAVLAVPFFCAIHLLWAIHGRSRWTSVVPFSLLVAAALCLPGSTHVGIFVANVWRTSYTGPFVDSIRAGKPMPLVVGDHSVIVWHWKHILDYLLPELKKRGIGMFQNIAEPPEYDAVPIAWTGAKTEHTTIDGNVVTIGKDASFTIKLPTPTYAEVLRFVCDVERRGSNVIHFRMDWRDSRREAFDEMRSSSQLFDLDAHGTPAARRAIHRHEFWATVGRVVDEVRITLDGEPETLRIESLDALSRK